MRIKWNADNAREIRRSLEDIRSSLESCVGQSDQIHTALAEANPNGANKRLRRLEESFDVTMRRVKRLMDEAEELREATDTMTRLFDDSEAEALRVLNSLDLGQEAGRNGVPGGGGVIIPIRPSLRPGRLPIILPRPVIAPMPRLPIYGPLPIWLLDLVNTRTFTIKR